MVDGTFAKASKVVLFIVNILFWLLGCGLLGVGIYSELERNSNNKLGVVGTTASFGPVALIIGGALVFIIGFSGCCGAVKEHRGLLILYASLVSVIFVLEIAAGIFAFVKRDNLETYVTDGMQGTLNDYDPDDANLRQTKVWDTVQREVKCCGVRNASSWEDARTWRAAFNTTMGNSTMGNSTTDFYYPGTCCSDPTNATTDSGATVQVCIDTSTPNYYSQGCYDEVLKELKNYWKAIAGIGIGVALFQVLVIAMACCLQQAIKRKEYTAV